jgi:hypothetical protein
MIDLKELLKAGCGGVHLNPSYVRHWRYIYIYMERERERERLLEVVWQNLEQRTQVQ